MPYVTVAEIRAMPNVADTTKFPDATVEAAIDWFEATFEDYTNVAWVPRSVTETYDGSGSSLLLRRWPVRAVTAITTYAGTASTAYTADELAALRVGDGHIEAAHLPYGTRNVEVTYEYGYDKPPADVKRAAKIAVRDHLLSSLEGNRVYAVQTEQGIVRTSTPGPDRPFGIPEVDAVANRRRMLVVA